LSWSSPRLEGGNELSIAERFGESLGGAFRRWVNVLSSDTDSVQLHHTAKSLDGHCLVKIRLPFAVHHDKRFDSIVWIQSQLLPSDSHDLLPEFCLLTDSVDDRLMFQTMLPHDMDEIGTPGAKGWLPEYPSDDQGSRTR
jgi:hypothetical protein